MNAGRYYPADFFYQYHIYLSCVKLPITNKFLQFNLGEFADNFAIPTSYYLKINAHSIFLINIQILSIIVASKF